MIFSFIQELAEFERLAHEVVGTAERLREHLFGPSPKAEALLAEVGGRPAGFVLFFHNFSTFLTQPGLYIEDLYVRAEFRGYGVGKALFAAVAKLALERDCGRVEWWVLDWNRKALDFYAALGAEPMSDWTVQRLTGEALRRVAGLSAL